MKRSEINAAIRHAEAFFAEQCFHLPPFAHWPPETWTSRASETELIRSLGLGWDVTDLGGGDFANQGLLLFTLRNGDVSDPQDPKCYAEKIMTVRECQITPWHFHWTKTEDIINRGGGDLVVEVAWASNDESELAERDVTVCCDGLARTVTAQGKITLRPGESVTLPPKLYHQFYGLEGSRTTLVGEVSRTNDDRSDNRFLKPLGRFPAIEEDESPYRLLCHEYPT